MLKQLRIKFIIMNMVLAALILVVAFSTVCFLDYRTRVDSVYNALDDALHYATASLYDSHSSSNNMIDGPVPLSLNLELLDRQELQQSASVVSAPTDDQSAGSAGGSAQARTSDLDVPAASSAADQAAADGSAETAPTDIEDELAEATPPEIGGDSRDSAIMPIAVYVVDAQGNVSVLTRLTSASISEEVREQAIQEAQESSDAEGYLSDVGLYFSKRVAFSSLCIAFADGSTVSPWVNLAWSLAAIGLCSLGAFFVIAIFFSRWAFKPVEAAWRAQQQFTADASHELKTPLTVILANMQILQSHPEDTIASQSQWIESTQTEGESMRLMINDMLDLARPEAMRTPAILSDVDLTDLLEGDALQFESVAFERGIDLELAIDPNVHVTGDAMRLHRLTSTLIDNACKYADEGGSVRVALHDGPREARLVVRNSGAVISPEDLPHIFDRFYRADKARTRDTGSYGLGLAIAREVAQQHGGDISVTSSEGEGTTFTVTLPK